MPNAMVFPGGRVDGTDADNVWHDLVVEPAPVEGLHAVPQLAHYIAAAARLSKKQVFYWPSMMAGV